MFKRHVNRVYGEVTSHFSRLRRRSVLAQDRFCDARRPQNPERVEVGKRSVH
jgi:hypothetical protein